MSRCNFHLKNPQKRSPNQTKTRTRAWHSRGPVSTLGVPIGTSQGATKELGATEELLAQMFQNALTEAVVRWFLNLDDAKARSWEDICCEFHNQYKYNIEVDVTRKIWRPQSKNQKNLSLPSLPSGGPKLHR